MPPPQLTALLLAALLAAPLPLVLRQRRGAGTADAPFESRRGLWLLLIHGTVTLAAFASLAADLATVDLPAHAALAASLMLAGGGVALLAAPFRTLAGPLAYLLLSYTFPREHAVTSALMSIGTMGWVAALSVSAASVWSLRGRGRIAVPGSPVVLAVLAFSAWLAIAIVAAVAGGRPLDPDMLARSARYTQATALFVVAAISRPNLLELRALTLCLSLALVVRQLLLTDRWLNEQNLAMLAAMTAPLALALGTCRPWGLLQIPLAATGAYLAGMVVFVQNRGAVLGLAASLAGLAAAVRGRAVWLVGLAIVAAAATVAAARAGLLGRFLEIYGDGRFLGTAAERLDIWRGGLGIAADHWLVGVGPGNFEHFLAGYVSAGEVNNPHNSFLEVLSETGIPGLVLFTAMFVVLGRHLIRLVRGPAPGWRRSAAAGLLGTSAAYLVTGFFLSNPSLVLMWVLLGVASALQAQPAAPPAAGG